MERVITCPVCFDSDHCFEDTLPEHDNFKSYMCFKCGFTSNSYFTEDSAKRMNHIEGTARIVKDLEFFDAERGLYWYPSVVNMQELGIIFPEGNPDNWYWKYAKVIEIPEEQRGNFPVPGKDGEFYESRLDVEGAQRYGQYEFFNAIKDMGIVKEL